VKRTEPAASRRYDASAERTDDGWVVTVFHPCQVSVRVRSLDEADAAVKRAVDGGNGEGEPEIDLHIYWYH
jgi:hypothetical protein